jgi:hypothetical protein
MIINADEVGNILAAGRQIYGAEYDGDIPEDFMNTFSQGKYLFVDGAIVLVAGWVAPVNVSNVNGFNLIK